jgi:hypothetical protein
MNNKTRSYLIFLSFLIILTTVGIASDMYVWRHVQAEKMITFQRMVGGLGMGAISTPLFNFINYDPRLQPVDDSITWPVPGMYSYGPDRTATVSYFEEIPRNQLIVKDIE